MTRARVRSLALWGVGRVSRPLGVVLSVVALDLRRDGVVGTS